TGVNRKCYTLAHKEPLRQFFATAQVFRGECPKELIDALIRYPDTFCFIHLIPGTVGGIVFLEQFSKRHMARSFYWCVDPKIQYRGVYFRGADNSFSRKRVKTKTPGVPRVFFVRFTTVSIPLSR